MRVHFADASVFDDPTVFDSLNRLFARVDQGIHELSFQDVDGLLQSKLWKVGIADYKRPAWEERLRYFALDQDVRHRDRTPGDPPDSRHVLVVQSVGGRTKQPALRQIAVAEIGAWSETPLRLLLENNRDFKLLIGAVRVYEGAPTGRLTWLELAQRDRALHIDGRGGCGEVWTVFKDLTYAVADGAQVRIFVMLDSDQVETTGNKGTPQRNIERWVAGFAKAGVNQEIRACILTKREIENYIPRALLEVRATTPESKRAFRAWDKLSDMQRDHDDMKARFSEEWATKCMNAMGDEDPPSFTAQDLDARAGQELRDLLIELKERL